jgi:hypothetical protein
MFITKHNFHICRHEQERQILKKMEQLILFIVSSNYKELIKNYGQIESNHF